MDIIPFILKLETKRILSSRADTSPHGPGVLIYHKNTHSKFELTICPRKETYYRIDPECHLPYPLDEEKMTLRESHPSIYVKHVPKGEGDLTIQIAVDLFGSKVPKHTHIGAVGLYREKRHNSFVNLGDPEFFDIYERLIVDGLNERVLHPFEGGFGGHYLLYAAIASPAVKTRIKYLSLWTLLEKMREDVPMAKLQPKRAGC